MALGELIEKEIAVKALIENGRECCGISFQRREKNRGWHLFSEKLSARCGTGHRPTAL